MRNIQPSKYLRVALNLKLPLINLIKLKSASQLAGSSKSNPFKGQTIN